MSDRAPIQNRDQWAAQTPNHVVYIAHDETSYRRILLEEQRIEWARSIGVPTPPVVHACGDWLVYRRVPDDPLRGHACVDALCSISERIEDARRAPPGELVPFQGWHPSRGRILLNYLKLYRKGIDVLEFGRVTRALRSLPRETLAHGDFHRLNLLHDVTTGVVNVVDWETLSHRPRFTDLMTAWPRLTDPDDRTRLLDHVLRRSPDLSSLGLLHLFGALKSRNWRALYEDRGPDGSSREPAEENVETALALVAEARSRAISWRG